MMPVFFPEDRDGLNALDRLEIFLDEYFWKMMIPLLVLFLLGAILYFV